MANTLKFGNGEWATKKGSTLAYNDENGNFKPLPFTFDRSTSATRVNKEGLIEVVSNNEPRIDFLNDSNGALLLEPQRSNLITYSEDFSQWTLVGDSIIKTEEKAFGKDVWRLTETSAGFFGVFTNCQETGLFETTISVLAKENTSNQLNLRYGGDNNKNLIVDLSDGSVLGKSSGITEHIKDMGNGWFLVSSTITLLSTNVSVAIYTKSGSIDIIFAQEEAGSYATSYIPTQGSAVTRVADSCINSGNDQVINSTEGVLYFEGSALADDANNKQMSLNDGGANTLRLIYNANNIRAFVQVSATTVVDISHALTNAKNVIKVALKYKINDYALWVNGVEVGVNTNAPIFSANLLDRFSFNDAVGSTFYSKTKDVKVYNTALSDSELQALTQV